MGQYVRGTGLSGLIYPQGLGDTGHGSVIMPWASLGRTVHFLMVERGDPFSLLGTRDFKSEVLGPVLDSPVLKQYSFN